MAYLQFSPLPDGNRPDTSRLIDDLTNLHGLLGGPTEFPFWLFEVEVRPNAVFERIKGLPKGSAETAETLRNALLDEPLFEFTAWRQHSVKGARNT